MYPTNKDQYPTLQVDADPDQDQGFCLTKNYWHYKFRIIIFFASDEKISFFSYNFTVGFHAMGYRKHQRGKLKTKISKFRYLMSMITILLS